MVDLSNLTITKREYDKFQTDSNGDVVVNTIIAGGKLTLSGLSEAGRITEVALTTSWLQVIATPLASRKGIAFQNLSDNLNKIRLNYNNTSGNEGWRITDGASIDYALDDSTTYSFYLKMESGTGTLVINEFA